jgi:hypothetical protein
MSATTTQLEAFHAEEPESSDPTYLAWRDRKVENALKAARSHPERRRPQSEVWKKFGLEA